MARPINVKVKLNKDVKYIDLSRYAGTYGGYSIEEPKCIVWWRRILVFYRRQFVMKK